MKKNENTNAKVLKINRSVLIKDIAKDMNVDKEYIKQFFWSLQDHVYDYLMQATRDESISLNLMDGFSVDSHYRIGGRQKNNLTGEEIVAPDKIVMKSKISREYMNKLNKDREIGQ